MPSAPAQGHHQTYTLKRHATWSIKEAARLLSASSAPWMTGAPLITGLRSISPAGHAPLGAGLKLHRELGTGPRRLIELRQDDAFRPIFMRRRA